MTALPAGNAHGEPFEPAGVTWSSVSGRLATARRLIGCGADVAVGVVLVVLGVVTGIGWFHAGAGLFAVGAVWGWWIIGRQVPAIGYAEQADDLLVRRGIMWRQIVVVPYGRLQFVEVDAGPIDRVFGISRVQLHTASASTDAVIPGLRPTEAARLRDRLTERGQARLAGL